MAASLGAAACGSTPAPASGPPKSVPALKLVVLDAVGGHLAYCDPDLYPVARGDPLDSAKARLPTIEKDRTVFDAILQHEGLTAGQQFTDQQLLTINDLYKQMQVMDLTPADGGFAFDVLVATGSSINDNQRVSGTVSRSGSVSIEDRMPRFAQDASL